MNITLTANNQNTKSFERDYEAWLEILGSKIGKHLGVIKLPEGILKIKLDESGLTPFDNSGFDDSGNTAFCSVNPITAKQIANTAKTFLKSNPLTLTTKNEIEELILFLQKCEGFEIR